MSSESFTKLGIHMPYMWIFGMLALILIPLSRMHSKRVWWFCYAIPVLCMGLSFLWLPTSYLLVADMVLFGIGLSVIILRSDRKPGVASLPPILFAIFAGLIPTLMLSLQASNSQEIMLTATRVFFIASTRHDPIDRDHVDIKREDAWIGGGSYWTFDGPVDHQSGMVASEDVYYSQRYGLMRGDEVAKHLAKWAGTQPRTIVNGESRTWKNPHPYQSL